MTDVSRAALFRARMESEVVPVGKLGLATYFGNKHEPKTKPDRWCRFVVIDGSEDQVDFGAETNTFRTVGVAVAQVFHKAGDDEDDIRADTDGIKAAFRGWRPPGVYIQRIDSRRIGKTGQWFQRNVIIEFDEDERY